jgi:hypothetical protein
MLGSSGVAAQLAASQEGFSSMKLLRLFNHLQLDSLDGNYIVYMWFI